ncbi:MAG: hypothetical protein HFF50_07010 [Lawsonibacter sp.]|nr:hypothetical protein [Lawsonibacter sp.]
MPGDPSGTTVPYSRLRARPLSVFQVVFFASKEIGAQSIVINNDIGAVLPQVARRETPLEKSRDIATLPIEK